MPGEKYGYVTSSSLTDDFDVVSRDLVTGLQQTTTSHGIPHVAKAKGWCFFCWNKSIILQNCGYSFEKAYFQTLNFYFSYLNLINVTKNLISLIMF